VRELRKLSCKIADY